MLPAREVESGSLFSSRQGTRGAYLSSNLIRERTLADWPWSADAVDGHILLSTLQENVPF